MRCVLALVLMTSIATAAPDAKQLGKDRVAAAEKVFTGTVLLMKAGRATVETVYGWSVRWLESELATGKAVKAALADHLARMTTLDADTAKAFQAGTAGATERDAAGYFKLEAELWVLRGKR